MDQVVRAETTLAVPAGRERAHVVYWLVAGVLLLYVAVCTPQRVNNWGADAWEHHRAVVALTESLWKPGNPTYATDEPSIRYSPYSVAIALFCRYTGIDAQHALSGAAIVNTVLLILALQALLEAYGVAAIGPHVLVAMVVLYGTTPGYANSYALADLPLQQVNPSALSLALALFMWAMLRQSAPQRKAWGVVGGIGLLGAACTLSHGHTGVFAFAGAFAVAVAAGPAEVRRRLLRRCLAAGAISFALCVAWPWYSFLAAVLNQQDRLYWFNPVITKLILSSWSLPALLCVPLLLSLRRHELARSCLIGAAIGYALAVMAFPLKSSVLARIGLPAMLFLHVAIGLYLHEHRLLHPAGWRRIVRGLRSTQTAVAAPAALHATLLIGGVYCLLPQLNLISRDPGLARAYLAPVLGKPDHSLHLKQRFENLLAPVGSRDVVLSDLVTSWPVPSFRGRVVAGLHYEAFTPDQPARERDVQIFFADADDRTRREIVHRYGVRWILLNPEQISRRDLNEILVPDAVVREVDGLILMDADRWASARQARPDGPRPTGPTCLASLARPG